MRQERKTLGSITFILCWLFLERLLTLPSLHWGFVVFLFQLNIRVASVSANLLLFNLGPSGVASPVSMLAQSFQYSPVPKWSLFSWRPYLNSSPPSPNPAPSQKAGKRNQRKTRNLKMQISASPRFRLRLRRVTTPSPLTVS